MVTSDATRFANFILHPVETGRFLLDGGAMFGVVPKTLWSRHPQPDESNRIPMPMRSLLNKSEMSRRTFLVDYCSSNTFTERMLCSGGLYSIHRSLSVYLHIAVVRADEITALIFTHLHLDHGCRTTSQSPSNQLTENFP